MANVEIKCECGRMIKGMNESILKMNLETHKRGNKHKELMAYKENWLKEVKKPRSHTKVENKE